jgi:hypothetical protein
MKQWMLTSFMGEMTIDKTKAGRMPGADERTRGLRQQMTPEIETKTGSIEIHPRPNQAPLFTEKGHVLPAYSTEKNQGIKLGKICCTLPPHLHDPQRDPGLPSHLE